MLAARVRDLLEAGHGLGRKRAIVHVNNDCRHHHPPDVNPISATSSPSAISRSSAAKAWLMANRQAGSMPARRGSPVASRARISPQVGRACSMATASSPLPAARLRGPKSLTITVMIRLYFTRLGVTLTRSVSEAGVLIPRLRFGSVKIVSFQAAQRIIVYTDSLVLQPSDGVQCDNWIFRFRSDEPTARATGRPAIGSSGKREGLPCLERKRLEAFFKRRMASGLFAPLGHRPLQPAAAVIADLPCRVRHPRPPPWPATTSC